MALGGSSRLSPPLNLVFLSSTGGSALLCGPSGHLFLCLCGFGCAAQGGHHREVLFWPAPAHCLFPAPFVWSAFAFAATTATLAAPFVLLLHLFDQCFALIQRVAVLPAVYAVGTSGGGVFVAVVKVGVFRTPRIAVGCRSVVLPNSLPPLFLCVELTHVLSGECASPRLYGSC